MSTSSPARSWVVPRTGTSAPSRRSMLTQVPSARPGSASIRCPSAAEPGATRRCCSPTGSSRSRIPETKGSGSTTRIRIRSSPADRRHQPALHHDRDSTTTITRRCRTAARRRPVRAEQEAAEQDRHRALEPGEQHEGPLRRGRAGSAAAAQPDQQRPDHEGQRAPRSPDRGPTRRSRVSTDTPTVRPRTTNATISPRLASAAWNRSISRLYGARSSPITMPGDEHREEPGAVRDGRQPEQHQAHRPASAAGTAPRPAAAPGGMNHSSAPPPSTPTTTPTPICSANLASATCPNAAPLNRDPADSSARHQRDADRVVGAGLPLQDRAAAARRLPAGRARRTPPRDRWAPPPSPTSDRQVPVQAERRRCSEQRPSHPP